MEMCSTELAPACDLISSIFIPALFIAIVVGVLFFMLLSNLTREDDEIE